MEITDIDMKTALHSILRVDALKVIVYNPNTPVKYLERTVELLGKGDATQPHGNSPYSLCLAPYSDVWKHPSIPEIALSQIRFPAEKSWEWSWNIEALQNPSLSAETVMRLWEDLKVARKNSYSEHTWKRSKLTLLKHPNMSPEIVNKEYENTTYLPSEHHYDLYQCPSLSEEYREEIMEAEDPNRMNSLLKNPTLSVEHIQRISRYADKLNTMRYDFLVNLVSNPNTPEDILRSAVKMDAQVTVPPQRPYLLWATLKNPNTPLEAVMVEYRKNMTKWTDKADRTLKALASNPKVSEEVSAFIFNYRHMWEALSTRPLSDDIWDSLMEHYETAG